MKLTKITLSLIMAFGLFACGGGENGSDSEKEEKNQRKEIVEEIEEEEEDCEKTSIDDWNSFMGIEYGTNETKLEKILGDFTGGEYTADSAAFKYFFNRIDLVPVTIYVNGKTGKVETIFMEILSKVAYFENDLAKAEKEFNLEECDSKWYGMKVDEVINILGEPTRDEVKEEGERSISYDSDPLQYSVNFRFYPSQGDMCTSVTVNWYY